MEWIWVIGILVVVIVAALLWWLFSRNSSSAETGALAHTPGLPTHGPADAAGQNPVVDRVPAADRGPAAERELSKAQQPPSAVHQEHDGGAEPAAASAPQARDAEPTEKVAGPAGTSDASPGATVTTAEVTDATAETAEASQAPPSRSSQPPVDLTEAARDQERQARDADADRPLGDPGTRQEHVADAMYEEEVSGTAVDEDLMVEETMPESPGASGTTTAPGAETEEPPPAEVEDAAAEQSPPAAEPLYDETEWLGYAGEAVIEPSVAAENGDGPDRRRG
ncbi:MAG TPA: hypothetical protein VN601_09570 [Arthrobacter sp.]|nr:hypothetical protein [Arthrobacter sp.]